MKETRSRVAHSLLGLLLYKLITKENEDVMWEKTHQSLTDWVFFYCREGFLFSRDKIPPTRHQLLIKKEGTGITTRPTDWFSSGGNMAEAVAAERLTCWETAPDLAAAPRWNFPQISHHPPEKETAGTELFLGEAGRPPEVGAKKRIRVFLVKE